MDKVKLVEKAYLKEKVPEFRVGDTVDVHVKIVEADKERIQVFSGTVIARKGTGINEMFVVRRIVAGEGVERVFPIHAPSVVDIVVQRPGSVRRAKLYYLRDRIGKATKVKERQEALQPGAKATKSEKKAIRKAKSGGVTEVPAPAAAGAAAGAAKGAAKGGEKK
jgi:large subunit ribosomal protein L19